MRALLLLSLLALPSAVLADDGQYAYRCICQTAERDADCNGIIRFRIKVNGDEATIVRRGDRHFKLALDETYEPAMNTDYRRYKGGLPRGEKLLLQKSLFTGGELLLTDAAGKKSYGGFAQGVGTERHYPTLYLCSVQR